MTEREGRVEEREAGRETGRDKETQRERKRGQQNCFSVLRRVRENFVEQLPVRHSIYQEDLHLIQPIKILFTSHGEFTVRMHASPPKHYKPIKCGYGKTTKQ